jgi:hypothetical protein
MSKFFVIAPWSLLLIASAAAASSNGPPSRASVTPSATAASLSNVSSSADDCGGVRYSATVTFTGTTNDGGGNDTVWFTIYDDQQEKYARAMTAPLSQSRSYSVSVEYPGGVGAIAPGIGVYLGENRGTKELIDIDPFFPTSIGGCSIGGTAPALSFSPNTGTTISYSASGNASPIAVGNGGGGSGSGPVATTTLTTCTISNGGAAFPTSTFNPNISVVAEGQPSPAQINLPACVPQSSLVNATLTCNEVRSPGGTPRPRTWTLACPIAIVAPPPLVNRPGLISAGLGGGVPNAASQRPRVSNNAMRLAFTSAASDLVPGDSNGRDDIFLRDRVHATTTRISSVAEPLNPGAAESYADPSLSADGSTVAFAGSSGQVYAAVNGVGRRVSASASGNLGNGPSSKVVVPGGGTLAFFQSAATNLLPGADANGAMADIFVKDLNTEAVILISRGPNGEAADGPSSGPGASADGQSIVFSTLATNIVPAAAPTSFSERFDSVTPPNVPAGWSSSNLIGLGFRWSTIATGNPPAPSQPNSVGVDDESAVADKILVSPALRVDGAGASLTFQFAYDTEAGFDGTVLEISVNGGNFVDVLAAGGSFTAGGYNRTISTEFQSPIQGRSAWSGASAGFITQTYTLPGSAVIATGSSVRFRWRMATDASIAGGGVLMDNVSTNNLSLASAQPGILPRGVKAGTIQQATMMRGGGFGQTRFYLSRNLSSGELGNGDSINVRITPDGRYGVFESNASNLIGGDTNGVSDIYRFEITNNQVSSLTRVSVSKTGEQGNGASRDPTITDDGQIVMFETAASNLISPDTNGASDVVLKVVSTGDVVRASQSADGSEPNGGSVQAHISGDGSLLAFCTGASNIVPGDNNSASDVFSAAVGVNPSGAWYDPNQDGHGLLVQRIASNRVVAFWYTFDPAGNLAYFIGDGPFDGSVATLSNVRPLGTFFPPNFSGSQITLQPFGSMTLTFSSCSAGRVDFNLPDGFGQGFMNLTRLTQPAGVDCGGTPSTTSATGPMAGATGVWYDPATNGQGLVFESLPGGVLLATWYTFGASPGGGQAWMTGIGTINGNSANLTMLKLAGGRFIPNFDPAQITRPTLGTATVTLSNCNNGTLNYNFAQGFGTGSMALQRLATPVGVICTEN